MGTVSPFQLPLFPLEKRCARCTLLKSPGDFYRNAACRDGLDPYCKACRNADNSQRKERKRAQRAAATEKRCRRCGHVFPVADFPPCARAHDGHQSLCRSCWCASYAERAPKIGAAAKGRRFTAERRAAMSAARRGTTLSQKHRAAISRGMKGHVKSADHRAKLAAAHRGKRMSEQARLNNARAQKGKKMTPQSLRKRSLSISGEKHWNWKGGATPDHLQMRRNEAYRAWRLAVYRRDHFTCQRCGIKPKARARDGIVAHHVRPWRDYPELRYDVANGVTLCRSCHCIVDDWIGKNFKGKGRALSTVTAPGSASPAR